MSNNDLNKSLFMFSSVGDLKMVKHLVEEGADVNYAEGAALFIATMFHRVKVIKYLKKHGAKMRPNYGTLLMRSMKKGL